MLVVTTAPLERAALRDEVRRHLRGEDARIRVVAPASKMSPLEWLVSDEDEAREEAEERAVRATEAVDEVAPVDARVGDPDPLIAMEDALATFPADEILVVTQRGADESWLEKDAARAAFERFALPVTHVVADQG